MGAPIAAVLVALTIAACGGGSATTTVAVRLTEWEMAVSPGAIRAGDTRFDVTNDGDLAHNLVLVKSDLPTAELPVLAGRVDVTKLHVAGSAGPFAPGTAVEGADAYEVNLSPGKYVLFCDVLAQGESHYQNGMFAGLLVEP
jgi:hypothetical protein